MRHEHESENNFPYGVPPELPDFRQERRGDQPIPPHRDRPHHPLEGQAPYGMKRPGPDEGGRMAPPPPPPPEDQTADGRLLGLLRMTGHLALTRPGLRSGQYRLLSILSGGEPIAQRQLSDRLRIQPGSLSELVNKLEQAGAVTRQRIEQDRRACTVQITQEGMERLRRMQDSMDIDRSELLCALTDEEKEQLTALLQKLLRSNAPRRFGMERQENEERAEETP